MFQKYLSFSLRAAALAVMVALAGGCATIGGGAQPQAAVDEQAVNALYSQLDKASGDYQSALEQSGGDASASTQVLGDALDRMKQAAVQCDQTPGCEPQRFVEAFDHLLRLKGKNLAGAAESDDDAADAADTDEPTTDDTGGGSPVLKALPEAQRSVTLLRGHKLSDLIAMNGPVKAALEEWLTWRRPQLMDAYVNYEYLRYRMWPAYKQGNLPEAILFGILAKESGGKVHAVSRSGAAGPLQFMYSTGRRFGLKTVNGFDQRFDPGLSAKANAAYMDEQLQVFNDNLELVLAAYNGGEGRLRRLVGDHPGVSFYDPHIYFALPPETREYVPMVLAAAWLFLHPDQYHLAFPRIDSVPGQIALSRPASLSELTVCLGEAGGMRDGWFRTLRNLNPRLDPQEELPAGTQLQVPKVLEGAYVKSCEGGRWPELASALHSGHVPKPPPYMLAWHYRVRSGDTLGLIVHRRASCSTIRRVAIMNHLRPPHYRIRIGQRLRLPTCQAR